MKKILCVDDDPTVQKLVSETLLRAGYDVSVAKDGIDAMRSIKKEKPDLLVLDIMMPELNGYDVCHSIKFNPSLKDLPIILLTSRDQELDPRLGLLMGIEYLHKSAPPKDLLDKVEKILSRG
ncbi:MAG: response regulator [Candidatus Omnitrophica bacterium]|nr:response regulator [Candidatus Omnitrophota bacterium]